MKVQLKFDYDAMNWLSIINYLNKNEAFAGFVLNISVFLISSCNL